MSDTRFAAYQARCDRAARLEAALRPANKAVLFAALEAAEVSLVTIAFDGCGDSGQFDAACAFDANDRPVALPIDDITIQQVDFETGSAVPQVTTPGDYIEQLACDFLEATHSGWEDGDGAQGEFRFSLADRTITLDHNERYTDDHHHEHEF